MRHNEDVSTRLAVSSFPSRFRERASDLPVLPDGNGGLRFTWRRTTATVVAGILALGMGYGVVFGHNGLTAFRQKREEEHRLRDQMQQLEHENARLRGHVERLQKDPGAIEHQAREELHYTRPGEVIYTLPASDAGAAEGVKH